MTHAPHSPAGRGHDAVDALQVGYFISYARWNYLIAPFLFTIRAPRRAAVSWQEDGDRGGVCT